MKWVLRCLGWTLATLWFLGPPMLVLAWWNVSDESLLNWVVGAWVLVITSRWHAKALETWGRSTGMRS